MAESRHHLLRLLHLASPSLPTGAFAYSQGLEWAVSNGWIADRSDLKQWLDDLVRHNLARVDIPVLRRMYAACRDRREEALAGWCHRLLALRESHELRMEEKNRGRALATLLESLRVPLSANERRLVSSCQLAGFALAAARWHIPLPEAASGYAWSWLENQVIAGIKLIPLGQTQGHQVLAELDGPIADAVEGGLRLGEHAIGASNPALAISSSRHETQYTRLFRS